MLVFIHQFRYLLCREGTAIDGRSVDMTAKVVAITTFGMEARLVILLLLPLSVDNACERTNS